MRTSRSNGSAVLEVEDTGMGIPAGEQEHLFERRSRKRAGARDLQAIAQAQGGLIEVTSSAGTTFRLVFPTNT